MSGRLTLNTIGKQFRYLTNETYRKQTIKQVADKCIMCSRIKEGRSLQFTQFRPSDTININGYRFSKEYTYSLEGQFRQKTSSAVEIVKFDPPFLLNPSRENKDLLLDYQNQSCLIPDYDYVNVLKSLTDTCKADIAKNAATALQAQADALKTLGSKIGVGIGVGAASAITLSQCASPAKASPGILFPECEWEESFNIVERRRDIFVEGERIRFDEPIASGPCPINVVLINTPGEYRLSVKTFKMKGFDAVTLNGLLAPEPGPPDPWRNHVPMTDWREIVPPMEEDQVAYPGQRKQIPTSWSSSELGASNFRNSIPGLSPVANINGEQALAALEPALQLLSALSAGAYATPAGIIVLSIECALEQALGGGSNTIY